MQRLQSIAAGALILFSATLFTWSFAPQLSAGPADKGEEIVASGVTPPTQKKSAADTPRPAPGQQPNAAPTSAADAKTGPREPRVHGNPRELRLKRASRSFEGDLRVLPFVKPAVKERPERKPPPVTRVPYVPQNASSAANIPLDTGAESAAAPSAPAPSTTSNFDGLDNANWGAGHPPDTNGDVGKDYYIQTINSSVGIYRKSDGVRVAAFTLDTFMSQGHFGNVCDTDNFGDPVVLYDSFEDRWIVTDFAFQLDNSGNVRNPPGAFECFAASKTGDPVNGGWNFYSIEFEGGLGDYPKLGVWPDGIYMAVNMFDYSASGSFQNVRAYAVNKAQMYAGAPEVQSLAFDLPPAEFTALPANAKLQTGTPPAGRPNIFAVVWQFTNAISFYEFHADWIRTALSTLTGPFTATAPAAWANPPDTVPSQSGNNLDTLAVRLMAQNQYSNIGGVESLWNSHTVQGSSATQAAVRYYQVNVTNGSIASTTTQAATHNPDTMNRFMPSVAVDRAGDMAIGYSTSSSTSFPAIKYAGRLAGDVLNAIAQTETTLINGTGTQTGNCGGSACERWGDYSAMSLDPDGCTFWYTSEYYATSGLNDLTRIGAFKYSQCTSLGAGGTLSGVVTAASGGAPINGATVTLGTRTATTGANGAYSFTNIPAGTYPQLVAAAAGYTSASSAAVPVTDAATTTRNFALNVAPAPACYTDSDAADFQTGVANGVDIATSPGDVTLQQQLAIDQQNTNLGSFGSGISTTTWGGQTFTPAVSGKVDKIEINLFCSGCTGTTPDLTVSIRASDGSVPTGADLAAATIPGFSSGSSAYFTATFSSPPTVTAGSHYAVVVRPNSAPSAGTYALTYNTGNAYTGGSRVRSTDSGGTWSSLSSDAGFKIYVRNGFVSSGSFKSGVKDQNPPANTTPAWTTLAWSADVPANSALKFQAAGSNNVNGPFNFVGPDGTAATFYTTSGGSLSQFNGSRFVKYIALLSNTASSATPTVHSVVVCATSDVPHIVVEQPAGSALTSGSSSVNFGTLNPGATASRTFTIRNTGTANLTGLGVTFDGANAADFSVSSAPTSPVTPSGSTAFTVLFNPIAAGSRNAAMHIASNDPAALSFDVALSGTRLTNSEAWRLQYFGSAANTGDGADTSDPDRDGVPNLLEFATGGVPNVASAMPGTLTLNGSTLEFRYTKSKAAVADGLQYKVEWTDSLPAAVWSTTGVTEIVTSEDATLQQIKASVSAGTNKQRFLRLKVTRP